MRTTERFPLLENNFLAIESQSCVPEETVNAACSYWTRIPLDRTSEFQKMPTKKRGPESHIPFDQGAPDLDVDQANEEIGHLEFDAFGKQERKSIQSLEWICTRVQRRQKREYITVRT
jgi:hypothetical protein